MGSPWPPGFDRVPDEEWVTAPIDELAAGYDALAGHGWYANLDPTIAELGEHIDPGQVVVDYSGGTGILARRLLATLADTPMGLLIVDASAKFLRLALQHLGDDERVAIRRLHWLDDDDRLQTLPEVVPAAIGDSGVDVLACANAVHLYPELPPVFASWATALRSEGVVHVQSGNIGGGTGTTIDDTVWAAAAEAQRLAGSDARYEMFAADAADADRLARYDDLRRRYFLPVRPLEAYLEALGAAGFAVTEVTRQPVAVRLDEWESFLAVYHEGIIGWAGGTARIDGIVPDGETVELRRRLLGDALRAAMGDRDTFDAEWTYVTGRRE